MVPAGIVPLTLPKAMYSSNPFLITHPLQLVQSPTAETMAKNCKMVEWRLYNRRAWRKMWLGTNLSIKDPNGLAWVLIFMTVLWEVVSNHWCPSKNKSTRIHDYQNKILWIRKAWRRNYVILGQTVHTHHWFKITLPNTEQAHDKHLWTTTNNFSQVQLHTPWWGIAHDPKHVGVIFNFVSFKLLYNVDFKL